MENITILSTEVINILNPSPGQCIVYLLILPILLGIPFFIDLLKKKSITVKIIIYMFAVPIICILYLLFGSDTLDINKYTIQINNETSFVEFHNNYSIIKKIDNYTFIAVDKENDKYFKTEVY